MEYGETASRIGYIHRVERIRAGFRGYAAKGADMDYKTVELAAWLSPAAPPEAIKRTLDRLGMRAVSIFVGLPDAEELMKQIRYANTVGARYLILMHLELDLYWAAKAGLDPRQALLKYSGLSPLVHVKDMDAQGDFTEVGKGVLDWPSLFAAFDKTGVRYYFVEQDVSPNPLESVKISLDYLRSAGLA